MNIAETLSVLLTRTFIQDLPPKTLVRAGMRIASTLAGGRLPLTPPGAAELRR